MTRCIRKLIYMMSGEMMISGEMASGFEAVLTPDAQRFVAKLARRFGPKIKALLEARVAEQARYDAGEKPNFLEATRAVREGDWTVAPLPKDLSDRRVEITGPVERKMIINALNSGANVFMADFEDSNAPTWENAILGQINLRDAINRTITFKNEKKNKLYTLNDEVATLMVRPRGLHLFEKNVKVDDEFVPGSLFDFGLYFFHNAKTLLEKGSGPYFYLPKLQSHEEAQLWNDVFVMAQDELGVPQGTIKATVLIETLPAAFQMHEILHSLKDHSAGLNCGRWDYIFSYIKTLRNHADFVIPDRGDVGMTQPFMRAYTQLLIQTCHKREVFAMGGMAAQIPIKSDPAANEAALEKVRQDKLREVQDGHDGTWVAHPGLVGLAKDVFDAHMKTPNQIDNKREDVNVSAEDLIRVPTGHRTEAGLRHSIRVGLLYIESWMRGVGCVPIYNLMEDAATAEICRTQIWQWVRHQTRLDDGTLVDRALVGRLVNEEIENVKGEIGEERYASGRFDEARQLFEKLATAESFEEFLTLPAYEYLLIH